MPNDVLNTTGYDTQLCILFIRKKVKGVFMGLLILILAGAAIIFGITVIIAGGFKNFVGGGISVVSGMYAFDTQSLLPLLVGFVLMLGLQAIGFDRD